MKETKKVKEKTLAKEKLNAKGNIWKNKILRKQLDTIVDPQNKHTIVDQGCSWTIPSKIFECCFFSWF